MSQEKGGAGGPDSTVLSYFRPILHGFKFNNVWYFWHQLGLISAPIPGLSGQLHVDSQE